ncbi:hypothetical protein [Planctellipticum variicoloris]|uniref:hypothetical protein n=1 Tax=Planctellipticum variicoloris TaxID=3064265 RepID=UPI002BBD401F|nr:hypothetical protein SH412_000439 [Planctomycetaceae bacterium SH412]HTN02386.1 hypothetical protein [Planctomycetaceae bacterium]
MTWVGKLLVVLHLVLSIMFMALAGAVFNAHTNWKKARDSAQTQYQQEQRKAQDLDRELQAARTEAAQKIAALEGQVTQLTGERTNLQAAVTGLEAESKQLKVALDAERNLAQNNSTEAGERVRESQLLRAQNADLFKSRGEMVARIRDMEDKLFGQDVQIQQLNEKHEKTLRDNAKMREFLASNGLPTDTREMLVREQAAPIVRGLVNEVRKAEKGNLEYVEISLGSNDGLVRGHRATLYRGDQFLGRIRLVSVERDRAVGTIEEKAKNAIIEKGDNVTTKF